MKEDRDPPGDDVPVPRPGRDFDEAAAAPAAAPDIGPTIITHRFPLDGCVEAFATAADRSSGTIKVAFDPDRRPLDQAR